MPKGKSSSRSKSKPPYKPNNTRSKSPPPYLGSNIWKLIMNQRNLNKERAAKRLQSQYRGDKTRLRLAEGVFTNRNMLSKAVKVKGLRNHVKHNPQKLENARKKAGLRARPRTSLVSHDVTHPSFWTTGNVPVFYLKTKY